MVLWRHHASDRHGALPAAHDLEPEPKIAMSVGGNYYVGDADCSLANSESSRDDY